MMASVFCVALIVEADECEPTKLALACVLELAVGDGAALGKQLPQLRLSHRRR
jgi:hypothetical protein